MENEFTAEEIADLRKLLDQISKIAQNEDTIASKIGYKGNEVIISKPFAVEKEILEALEEREVDIDE
jgi:hypothetical protein